MADVARVALRCAPGAARRWHAWHKWRYFAHLGQHAGGTRGPHLGQHAGSTRGSGGATLDTLGNTQRVRTRVRTYEPVAKAGVLFTPVAKSKWHTYARTYEAEVARTYLRTSDARAYVRR